MSVTNWHDVALSEVCSLITDGTHHSPPNGPLGDFKYITAKNIKATGLDLRDLTYVAADIHDEIFRRCPPEIGDVLYIKDGVTTGVATVNTLNEPFSMLSSVALLKPIREVLSPKFLTHWLNSPETFSKMTGNMSGSAIRRLVLKQIREARFALPPLEEQHRIVAKIDSLFARSSRARDELAHIPKLIERYRQAVLEAAFRGDLTADWRSSHPSSLTASQFQAKLAEERWTAWKAAEIKRLTAKGKVADAASLKRRYSPPTASDKSIEISCPDDWVIASLDELGWDSSYGTSSKCAYEGDGMPVLRIPNVARGSLDLTDMKFALSDLGIADGDEISQGDLIVVRTNGSKDLVGRGAVVTDAPELPTFFASYLIRFRLVGDDLLRRWVALLWHSPIIRNQVLSHAATSAGQYNISMSELAGFALPLAPPAEMSVIIEKVESALVAINAVEAEYKRAGDLLPRLDASILDKAFSGQLVPQDPTDEPASKLLERIRTARAAAPVVKRGRKAKGAVDGGLF